jgi:hypothetical protein
MAITFLDVSTYLVFAYGGPNGNSGMAAVISLGVPNAYVTLRFYPDSVAVLPANSTSLHANGTPMFYVSYRYAQFSNVLDILRNEKPVKFFFRDDNLASYITTSNEPVGEGEN